MPKMKASSVYRGGKKLGTLYLKTEEVNIASDKLELEFIIPAPNGESILQVEVPSEDYPLILKAMMAGDQGATLAAIAERLLWLSQKLRREAKRG